MQAPITPIRLPPGVRTLYLYGGSFDPPTYFHYEASLAPSWMADPRALVLYIPAARSPLKPKGPVAGDSDRVAMLASFPDFCVNRAPQRADETDALIWTDEVDRAAWERAHVNEQPSYTIDTVQRLRRAVGTKLQFRLLIGTDQAVQFKRWKSWRELLKEAEPVVMLREPHTTPAAFLDALAEAGLTPREQLAWARRLAPQPPIRMSSTRVRELLKSAGPRRSWPHELTRHLSPEVARYLSTHALYSFKRPARSRAR
jgi:nicotinic acid mononucleotide adenylyltransferase